MHRAGAWLALSAAVGVLVTACTGGPSADSGRPDPSAPGTERPALEYVALGDSFTAAPGIAETDPGDGCQRSTQNYPALVAERLAESWEVELVDRSCIGADTTHLAGPQPAGTATIPPQLDAVSRDTDLVTLSMGGNDFGVFVQVVAGCLVGADPGRSGSPCRDRAAAQGDPWRRVQSRIEDRLVAAVAEIRRRAPDARVLLVGYPQLAPAEDACPQRLPLATGDLGFAREVNRALTDNLRRAADRTGATYVDVWAASAGHDICSARPWTNGRRGAPGDGVPLHPTAAGQAAVADLVTAAFRG